MTCHAIDVTGLRKSYGDHVVLDGVDLAVAEGSIYALLGPNGAGKTTIVQILSTLISADGGALRVAGHDPVREPDAGARRDRRHRPVLGRRRPADGAREPDPDGRPEPSRPGGGAAARGRVCSSAFDLVEAARRPAATYSGGMRRRLDLAMTLVGDPRIIFLDEPTTGLDPRSRHTMWAIIRELVAGGVTVFLTTQYLDEADELADRIAVLDRGLIVAEGTPDELKWLVGGGHIRLEFSDPVAGRGGGARARRGRRARTSRCRSPATAAWTRCATCWTGSTASRSSACPSTRPTSTTSSSP